MLSRLRAQPSKAILATLVLIAVLVVPAQAFAKVDVVASDDALDFLRVEDSGATSKDNDLVLGYVAEEEDLFVRSKTDEKVVAGSGCRQVDPREARCSNDPTRYPVSGHPGDEVGIDYINLFAAGGRDRIINSPSRPVELSDDVDLLAFGQEGADTLLGSTYSGAGAENVGESLYGGDGADYISAERGVDGIFGEAGADTLFAGPGNDYVDSTESSMSAPASPRKDANVNCGPGGDDQLVRDTEDSYVGCEEVTPVAEGPD